jgi:hypothetical protein
MSYTLPYPVWELAMYTSFLSLSIVSSIAVVIHYYVLTHSKIKGYQLIVIG